jgi:hypothetical protein
MSVDHVRFCADKYLKNSYGFRPAANRPDLAEEGNRLAAAAQASNAGVVLGVQTVDEHSDEIAFVVTENGILLRDAIRYIPYDRISRTRAHYQDKQDFRGMDLELDDGSMIHLKVESGHGKLRDAFAVSSFLGHLLRRLRQTHAAYRPVPA